MNDRHPEEIIGIAQLVCGLVVFLLIAFQVIKIGHRYAALRIVTHIAIALTISGIVFGKYYAGTAPQRLRPVESAQPLVAITGYTEAIRLNPDNSNLYFRRGRTDFHLQRYPDAINDFTKALELSPGNPSYLASRGIAYLFTGRFDLSESDINLALSKGFRDPEVSLAQGMLLETQSRYPEALEEYTEVLSAKDLDKLNRCTALLNRGVVYNVLENYRSGTDDFNQVIATGCGDNAIESAFVNLANANRAIGNYEGAVANWEAALRLDPNDPVIFRNRAEMYRGLGQLDLALPDYTRYLQLRSDDALSFLVRSEIYRQMGQLGSAEADRQTADRLIKMNRAKVYPLHTGPFGAPFNPKE